MNLKCEGEDTRRRGRTHPWFAVAMGVALVSACESSTPNSPLPTDEGTTFTASITGAVSVDLRGTATSIGTASGTPAWAVQMTASDGSGGISFTEEGRPRPTPGTYTVASALEHGGNAPDSEFTAVVGVASPASSFGSISGTLTITGSSATRVSGTFTFTAEDPTSPGRTVTVTGSFTANNRDT